VRLKAGHSRWSSRSRTLPSIPSPGGSCAPLCRRMRPRGPGQRCPPKQSHIAKLDHSQDTTHSYWRGGAAVFPQCVPKR
jgi:hypothetical protein